MVGADWSGAAAARAAARANWRAVVQDRRIAESKIARDRAGTLALPVGGIEVLPRVMARGFGLDPVHMGARDLRHDLCARRTGPIGEWRAVVEDDHDACEASVAALAFVQSPDLVGNPGAARRRADLREGAIAVPELA